MIKKDPEVVGLYHVQVGTFSQKAAAELKRKAVEAAGFGNVFLAVMDSKTWQVRLGGYPERARAEWLLAKVKAAGFSGLVTQIGARRG